MANMLLIITIPTELEEQRWRKENATKTNQDVESNVNLSYFDDCEGGDENDGNRSLKKAIQLLTATPRKSTNLYPKVSEIFEQSNNEKLDVEQQQTIFKLEDVIGDKNENKVEGSLKNTAITGSLSKDAASLKPITMELLETASEQKSSIKPTEIRDTNSNKQLPTMEQCLRQLLKNLGIINAHWAQDCDGRMLQIAFTIPFDEAYEDLMHALHRWGVGERIGSTVAVLSCLAAKRSDVEAQGDEAQQIGASSSTCSDQNSTRTRRRNRSPTRYRKSIWERFMNSVRSRMNIVQIVRTVHEDAIIDFDFMILLISAALLSAFGLIEDSLVFLASSMLISPLMGPIIAAIFGTVIKDASLRNLGIRNECLGVFISLLVGFFFGIGICLLDSRFESMSDITAEMSYRGGMHTLLMCSIAAIPSGAAVAIGILNSNMGSLIGVAISASLLPPAVNSGMLWAMALFYCLGIMPEAGYGTHEKLYSNDIALDFLVMSGVSMGITVLNIALVFITGVLLLKMKEIMPGIGGHNRMFWKRDIKIARTLSQHKLNANAAIIEEFSNLPTEEQKAMGIDRNVLRCIQSTSDADYQRTWSPGLRLETTNTLYDGYATVHRLEYLYSTMTQRDLLEQLDEGTGLKHRKRSHQHDFDYFEVNERYKNCHQLNNTPRDNETGNIVNTRPVINEDSNEPSATSRFLVTPVDEIDLVPDEYEV